MRASACSFITIACAGLITSACRTVPTPAVANPTRVTALPADLCSVLARVVDLAPSEFASIRGERIETPEGVDRAAWSISTLTPAGGRAVVIAYAWDVWQVSFDKPAFSRDELVTAVSECPVFVEWRRNEDHALEHGVLKVVFHAADTESIALQVVNCGVTDPCAP